MKSLLTATAVAALSALTFAARAQADDASFLEAAGPMPGPISQAGILQMGHDICSQLRINPSTDDLPERLLGNVFHAHKYVTPQAVDAAQHELCPDTLEPGFVPGQTDEARFLETAGPMPGPISQAGIVQMGHDICSQLRINPSTDDLPQRMLGSAFWVYPYVTPQVVAAAQHEMCPDTLR